MKHGTFAGYDYHGCRCSECRRFMADYRAHVRDRITVTVYPRSASPVDLRAFRRHPGGHGGTRTNYAITSKGKAYLAQMGANRE